MIARLTGTLISIDDDSLVLQVGGVGFRIFVAQPLLGDANALGEEMTLHTHLHVRENDLTLYGCETEDELTLFRLVQTVSGIGPRVALSMLSALPPDGLRAAIANEDVTTLARVPGIGPKTAKKLVFDLKDKVEVEPGIAPAAPAVAEADADLIGALTGLGYSVAEAREAIRNLPREPMSLEERVRLALAYFVS